jgi:hypothetical protein
MKSITWLVDKNRLSPFKKVQVRFVASDRRVASDHDGETIRKRLSEGSFNVAGGKSRRNNKKKYYSYTAPPGGDFRTNILLAAPPYNNLSQKFQPPPFQRYIIYGWRQSILISINRISLNTTTQL